MAADHHDADTTDELIGIARFRFHEGKVEEYKRLALEALEIVRTKDTGTLQYEVFFNDDESECIVVERYRNSEALLEHAEHLADLMEPILATGSAHGELLGNPNAQIRSNLADGPVRLFTRFLSL